MAIKLKWFKRKEHIHTPLDPVAVNLLRADNLRRGDGSILSWRCKGCGEMVKEINAKLN